MNHVQCDTRKALGWTFYSLEIGGGSLQAECGLRNHPNPLFDKRLEGIKRRSLSISAATVLVAALILRMTVMTV